MKNPKRFSLLPPFALTAIVVTINMPIEANSVRAADLDETCKALVDSGLVDTRNREFVVEKLVGEFNDFCSSESDLSTSLKSRSGGFQAGFKGFELGASGSKSTATTSEKYKAACASGEKNFANYMRETESTSTGSILAGYAVECTKILASARISKIFGEVDVIASDLGFNVTVKYTPGEIGLSYELSEIPQGLNCFKDKTNNVPAVGNVRLADDASSDSFFCTKEVGEPVEATLNFKAEVGGETKLPQVVKIGAASRKQSKETAEIVEKRVAQATLDLQKKVQLLEEASAINTEQLKTSVVELTRLIDEKTRLAPETQYIYLQDKFRDPRDEKVVIDKDPFVIRKLLPLTEGFCALTSVGVYREGGIGGILRTQSQVVPEQGFWIARVLNSVHGADAGVTCWRYK